MNDMKDIDSRDGITDHAIKYLIAAMPPMPHAAVFVSRHEGKAERCIREAMARSPQFGNKRHSTQGIVAGDIIADRFKIGFGVRQ